MGDIDGLTLDELSRDERDALMHKLLAYAGPPPRGNDGVISYAEWAALVDNGLRIINPDWDQMDVLDAVIQYRHWCYKRYRRPTAGKWVSAVEALKGSGGSKV